MDPKFLKYGFHTMLKSHYGAPGLPKIVRKLPRMHNYKPSYSGPVTIVSNEVLNKLEVVDCQYTRIFS